MVIFWLWLDEEIDWYEIEFDIYDNDKEFFFVQFDNDQYQGSKKCVWKDLWIIFGHQLYLMNEWMKMYQILCQFKGKNDLDGHCNHHHHHEAAKKMNFINFGYCKNFFLTTKIVEWCMTS